MFEIDPDLLSGVWVGALAACLAAAVWIAWTVRRS